ncbi:MAG: bifunctional DNA-formamidopyrimidine glycosylase/DNA-(apurinic or apyrimidinic site) lyase [Marinicella sp.]
MPELPEVETTLRGIEPWVNQQEIAVVNVFNAALRWPIPTEVHELAGQKIIHVYRRAKYLLLQLSNEQHLILHLGMSGVIRVVASDAVLMKHDHFELVLTNGRALRLNDPRRFGCVLLTDTNPNQHKLLKNLGPEPLAETFNGQWLKTHAKNRQMAVKNFIMNNQVVVGVGNIYAAESLFLAGIHPNRPAKNIALKRYVELASIIKQVLAKAIMAGGTTLNDFKHTDGKPGYFKQQLLVYGRAGEPCTVCGTQIKNMVIGQRASCYCPQCQN